MSNGHTSTVLSEPNIEISGWISWISFDQAFRTSRSCASYHDGPFWLPFRRVSEVPIGGSTETDFNGSGVMPRCISNKAEGIQGRSREDRLMAPCKKVLGR